MNIRQENAALKGVCSLGEQTASNQTLVILSAWPLPILRVKYWCFTATSAKKMLMSFRNYIWQLFLICIYTVRFFWVSGCWHSDPSSTLAQGAEPGLAFKSATMQPQGRSPASPVPSPFPTPMASAWSSTDCKAHTPCWKIIEAVKVPDSHRHQRRCLACVTADLFLFKFSHTNWSVN